MSQNGYRVELTQDGNDTILVTCPALPGVVTFGEDEADALLRAADAIEEMLAARMSDREDIPPFEVAASGPFVALPALTVLKVALYRLMRARKIRKADLARMLNQHAPQIDRLLDLNHASRLDQLEAAFQVLGAHVEVRVSEDGLADAAD